ncbi:O-antigen translocase [Flavobacterium amniphilum]|uniref:O-antigen translocase n=1 Tax=Flavobacterium amniphilum TaxID=1834035 RepID=UPI00202A1825|nr:O-antigen translocase [Flavobacterium amniphilum]MCL9805135.1 O-antigen translocase [Flavobacterium amniphilum]
MRVIKSGLYLAGSTGLKVVLGVVGIKVISYYIGVKGFGMLGQLMSLMAIIATTAGGGITNGVISKISQFKNDPGKVNNVISAGFWIGLVFSSLLGLFLLFFAGYISKELFEVTDYAFVIRMLAFLQFFNVFSVIYGGYLNGMQRSKFFSMLTIVAAIVGALGLILLVYFFKIPGAMLGLIWMAISPGIVFLISYFFKLRKEIQLFHFSSVDKENVKSLLKYSLMLIFSACLLPFAQVFVRKLILDNGGWDNVGYWQSAVKLSESGLIFLNVVMANYYLPELGKSESVSELKKIIKNAYLILIPLVSVYVIIVYFMKSILISLLFTESFQPAEELVTWQAVGDVFKVLCLVFGFLIILKEKLKVYLMFELLIFTFMITFSYIFVPKYGVIGANYAHVLTYFLCFLVSLGFMGYYFYNEDKL